MIGDLGAGALGDGADGCAIGGVHLFGEDDREDGLGSSRDEGCQFGGEGCSLGEGVDGAVGMGWVGEVFWGDPEVEPGEGKLASAERCCQIASCGSCEGAWAQVGG